jgi:hypothetical protein
MIPGSNIFLLAASVIGLQDITYYRYKDRTQNAAFQFITTYETAITIQGSFQPVQRDLYQEYGLDFQKNYAMLYCAKDIMDVQRDISGDKIVYKNKTYQCQSNLYLYDVDGWVGVMVVQID